MSATARGGKRSPADFYPTPVAAAALPFLHIALADGGRYLDPCIGDGRLVRVHQAIGSDGYGWGSSNEVQATQWTGLDIRPECKSVEQHRVRFACVDFLQWTAPHRYDCIVTNPPFAIAMEIIKKSMTIADHVVLLLRVDFLASIERYSFWSDYMPDVYVIAKRPFPDSCQYAWYHWKAHQGGVYRARGRPGMIKILPPPHSDILETVPPEFFEQDKEIQRKMRKDQKERRDAKRKLMERAAALEDDNGHVSKPG